MNFCNSFSHFDLSNLNKIFCDILIYLSDPDLSTLNEDSKMNVVNFRP